MAVAEYLPTEYRIHQIGGTAVGLMMDSTVITFAAGDDVTVEKFTSTLEVRYDKLHADSLYMLSATSSIIEGEYPGDLTVKTYNIIKPDNENEFRSLHVTSTVSSSQTLQVQDFLIQGLFPEGKITFGVAYGSNTEVDKRCQAYLKLYRL